MPWKGIFANLDAKRVVWVTTEPRSAAPITMERRCSRSRYDLTNGSGRLNFGMFHRQKLGQHPRQL